MKKNGFTLIELVVVITIIAIITVVGVVSFSGANVRARDSRRKSDLEKMRIALEVYRQENGQYPCNEDPCKDSSDIEAGLLVSGGYINELPKDPKHPTSAYRWGVGAFPFYYALYAKMEDLGSTTGSYNYNCGGINDCNYQVTSP